MRLPAPLRPLWPHAKALHTTGTGLVSPWSGRLGRGLPTGVAHRAEQASGRCVEAFPAERVRRPVPRGRPADHWRFREATVSEIPRTAVVELPDGRVLGPHGAVVDARGDLVWEMSPYFGTDRPGRHPLHLHPRRPEPVRVRGRLGVLTTRGDQNHYHFLLDVLPRIGVLERCPSVAPPERWLAPAATPVQRELLALAGVPLEAVVDSTTHPHVQADVLVVPGLPSADLQPPAWVVPFLRDRLLPADRPGPVRRLYVTRGQRRHTRSVRNEAEVLGALRPRGFEVLDPGALSFAEQARAFAGAEVVVAPHGAALANLVLASPGATVVELFAPDYVNTCSWALASQVPGVDYRYLLGRGAPRPRRERAMQGVASDIDVDVAALLEVLAEAGL